MAHNHSGSGGLGGYDPRFHGPRQQPPPPPQQQQRYAGYYDPRYQQRPYVPPQANFQIQIPMATGNYSGYPSMPQQQQQPPAPPQQPLPHLQSPHQQHMQSPRQQQLQSPTQLPHQQSPPQQLAQGIQVHANPMYHHQQPAQQLYYHQPAYQQSMQSPQFHAPPIQQPALPPEALQHHELQQQQQQPQPHPLQSPLPHQPHRQSPLVQHQSPPLPRSTLPQIQQYQTPQQQQQLHQYSPGPVATSLINGNAAHPSPKSHARPLATPVIHPAPAMTPPDSVPGPSPVRAPVVEPLPRPPTPMELEYTPLMIDLAEKYFETAYGTGPKGSAGFKSMPDSFCRLIATGLACLDVVLGELRPNLEPPIEAAVRLRYATILYDETENFADAEDMLSKGVNLCDRYRLTDLKYNMQHLLARVTFVKNQKAAVRYLDGVTRDIEAVNHVPWVYAMRFLRVALSLEMNQTQETLTALSQLKVINSTATSRKDHAVAAVANSIEALIQIHRSTSTESIELTQHALASARSVQLDSQAKGIHHLTAMTHFVDVLCSIYQASQTEAHTKMTGMNAFLEKCKDYPTWTANGEFSVPLNEITSQSSRAVASENGVVHIDEQGQVYLRMRWLPKDEIYTLAYIISAAVLISRNAQDGHQAEQSLQNAQKMLKMNEKTPDSGWRRRLQCEIQALTVFALCSRYAWSEAGKELDVLREMQEDTDGLSLHVLVPFLEANILQGTGEIDKALDIYTSPLLSISNAESTNTSSIVRDISLLATLNALLITCLPNHPRHSEFDELLSRIEPLAQDHTSRDMQAAYNLVRAVSLNTGPETKDTESVSMLKTKEYLTQALHTAKRTGNNQLCCITLNFMTWRYFRGVVGEQPVKSAMSAQNLAKKGHNSLWTSVADGLLADTLETQGRTREADATRTESLDLTAGLPEAMQRMFDQKRM